MSEQPDTIRWMANQRAAAERAAGVRRAERLTPDQYLDRAFEVIELANEWCPNRSDEIPEEDLQMYRTFTKLRSKLGVRTSSR